MTWRRIVLPASAGLITAGLTWLMGVVTVDAVLIGVLMTLLVGVPRWLGYPADRDWPGGPEDGGQRGYYEVRRLGEMFRRESSRDTYSRLIVPRLRELSERRLGAAGMSMGDADAREIIGADVFDWLYGRTSSLDSRSRVKQAELVLDRLDRFDEESRQV